MKKQEIGKIGEDKACEYLEKLNYRILQRNYREKFGEIDIIGAHNNRTLIFFEVKTLLSGGLKPEDNFTTQKYKKVKRICEFFVAAHPELIDEDMGWQIDLIAIEILETGEFAIRHYENI